MLTLLSNSLAKKPLDPAVYADLQSNIYADVANFFVPEIVVLVLILVMLVYGIFQTTLAKKAQMIHITAFLGLVGAYMACTFLPSGANPAFLDFGYLPEVEHNGPIGSMVASDGLSGFFRMFLVFTAILTVWMSVSAKEMRDRSTSEFYILMLGSLVGMMLLSSANHMLMVYLAVEMMSLPSYCLVALRRKQKRATEASLKYMLFGSVASGIMIYGLSLIYGMTGGLSFDKVAEGIGHLSEDSNQVAALGIGVFLFIVGIGYKMAIAPMHFWCPDAYEGAPTPVTAFLSVASKAAGFAVAIRFIYIVADAGNGTGLQNFPWVEMLAVLGVLTMTVGNLTALRQNNIKRMLAYSSIAHAGYLMIGLTAMAAGLIAGNTATVTLGITSMVVYLLAYLFTNYGAFGAVIALENEDNDNEDVAVFRSLAKRNLALAIFMFVILLSLLGVPPTLGFMGKLTLFRAGVDASDGNDVIIVMLIAAGINTAISAYYYFRIVKEMFLVDQDRGEIRPFAMPMVTKALVASMAVAIFGLFIFFGQVEDSAAVQNSDDVLQDINGIEGVLEFSDKEGVEEAHDHDDHNDTTHTAETEGN